MFDPSDISTEEELEAEGAGLTLAAIGRAIMIWSCMNEDNDRSVAACARAFNTTTDVIRDAVEEDRWAYLSPDDEANPEKQMVHVDGE